MGLLDILSPTGGAFSLLDDLIKRVWPDPQAQAQMRLQLLEMQQQGALAQLNADLQTQLAQAATNTEEAKSESLFKSGWRPFVGWVCGCGFGYMALARPLISWACLAFWQVPPPPAIDISALSTMLMCLLGIGTMRTVEKSKGVN